MIFDIDSPGDRELLKSQFEEGVCLGLTSGCFDLFHYYQLIYLQKCRRLCEFLIVGVDSDRLVRETKGEDRPIIPENQRIVIIAALECVGAAFVMDDVNDLSRAAALGVNMLFKNDAFKPEEVIGVNESRGTKLVIIPDVPMPGSTSRIIEEITRRQEESHGHADPGSS